MDDKAKILSTSTQHSEIFTETCSQCSSVIQILQEENNSLKEKLHEAFQQVIQIQQINEEEIEQLRADFQQKERLLKDQYEGAIEQYESKIRTYKNIERHTCEFQTEDLDFIQCSDTSHSKLDESSIKLYSDFLCESQLDDPISELIHEVTAGPQSSSLANPGNVTRLVNFLEETCKDKKYLMNRIEEISISMQSKEEELHQVQEEKVKFQKNYCFLADHVKKLNQEKVALQKKVQSLECSLKTMKNQQQAPKRQNSSVRTVETPKLMKNSGRDFRNIAFKKDAFCMAKFLSQKSKNKQ